MYGPDEFAVWGETLALEVPSTAKPSAPIIDRVVPAFRWTRKKNYSQRQCGLRVYLKGPWFSSGDGEQLAVVCLSGADEDVRVTESEATHRARVRANDPTATQWGEDPLFPPDNEAPEEDPNRVGPLPDKWGPRAMRFSSWETLILRKKVSVGAHRYEVALFDVSYDEQEKQWYCDIALDIGKAYLPFVKLALARYQPKSVEGLELSEIAFAEGAQVYPERVVNVTVKKDAENNEPVVYLQLTGPAPSKGYSYVIIPKPGVVETIPGPRSPEEILRDRGFGREGFETDGWGWERLSPRDSRETPGHMPSNLPPRASDHDGPAIPFSGTSVNPVPTWNPRTETSLYPRIEIWCETGAGLKIPRVEYTPDCTDGPTIPWVMRRDHIASIRGATSRLVIMEHELHLTHNDPDPETMNASTGVPEWHAPPYTEQTFLNSLPDEFLKRLYEHGGARVEGRLVYVESIDIVP